MYVQGVMRVDPRTAASAFVEEEFPDALAVLLAGSAARDEVTSTSDLDLVVIANRSEAPYRETFEAYGWPIEAFLYSPTTYATWFANDVARRRPSLPTMCVEGLVLRDTDGLVTRLKREATELLKRGPEPLSTEELAAARYRLTDCTRGTRLARARLPKGVR